MNEKYLNDKGMVHFTIASDYGINGEILLPITLVEDLENHMNEFKGVLNHPFKSVILNALIVYMEYINAELIPFASVKADIERCIELDMKEMMVVD